MADTKITQLATLTSLSDDDLLPVADNVATTPVNKSIRLDALKDYALTAQSIGAKLYPITAAETSAGVTPTDYSYPPGYVLRYGANTTPGTTDMTAAFLAAAKSSSRVTVDVDGVYIIDNLVSTTDVEFVLSKGVTLRHAASASNNMIETGDNEFHIYGGVLDGNKANQTQNVYLIEANGDRFVAEGVHFVNSVFSAIYLNGVSRVSIQKCLFTGMKQATETCASRCIDCDGDSDIIDISHNTFIGDTPSVNTEAAGGLFISGGTGAHSCRILGNYFENIGLNNTGFGLIAAVQLYTDADETVISNNTFINVYYGAVIAQNANNVVIANNVVKGFLGDGDSGIAMLLWGHARSHATAIVHGVIKGNIVDIEGNDTNKCINVTGDSDEALPSSSVVVSGNAVIGGDTGVHLEWITDAVVTGNSIRGQAGSASRGVVLDDMGDDSASVVISGNNFWDIEDIHIFCRDDKKNDNLNINISGNNFYASAVTPFIFISMRGDAGGMLESVLIANNNFRGSASTDDIEVHFADKVTVIGNIATTGDVDFSNNTLQIERDNSWNETDTATGTYSLNTKTIRTLIDSSGGAVTGTLGSGPYIGFVKTIVMTDATASSTVSVTNHETSDPEVITFAAVDDTAVLMWTGTEWITLKLSGASV